MDEIRYLISDASKKVDVETHVLRYWEEELGLSIPRNEMGHRYYTEFHIRLFRQVKILKDKGYQLKAIKAALQQIMEKNQEVVKTEEVLERDISKTLQENPRLGILYRISVDKPDVTRKVIEEQILNREPSNIARMQDYSRLEKSSGGRFKTETRLEVKDKAEVKTDSKDKPEVKADSKDKPEAKADSKDKPEVKADSKDRPEVKADSKDKPEAKANSKDKPEVKTDGKDKPVKTDNKDKAENETDIKINIEEQSREIEEKDGQAEMKSKRKSRTKPSAWERRNGIVVNAMVNAKTTVVGKKGEETKLSAQGEEAAETEPGLESERMPDIEDFQEENEDEPLAGEFSENERQPEETSMILAQQPKENELAAMTAEEKMEQFQMIMNQIIQRALEANNEKLSQDISCQVNRELAGELKELMRIRDEREEERFRQLDEVIRSCQRESQSKAEAAAARVPFFRKKRFRNGNPA